MTLLPSHGSAGSPAKRSSTTGCKLVLGSRGVSAFAISARFRDFAFSAELYSHFWHVQVSELVRCASTPARSLCQGPVQAAVTGVLVENAGASRRQKRVGDIGDSGTLLAFAEVTILCGQGAADFLAARPCLT